MQRRTFVSPQKIPWTQYWKPSYIYVLQLPSLSAISSSMYRSQSYLESLFSTPSGQSRSLSSSTACLVPPLKHDRSDWAVATI